MKKLLVAMALLFAADAFGAASITPTTPTKDGRNRVLLGRGGFGPGAASEIADNLAWSDLQEVGFEYTITFNEGASKGLFMIQNDGTVVDETAAILNTLYYGAYALNMTYVANTTTGDPPAAEATGLDIGTGDTANDNLALWGGDFHASGRPIIVGTDPAAKFCVDAKITDVDGTDLFSCGWRTAADAPVAVASYTSYCSIGNLSGDIYIHDKTNTTTDTTDNWADAAQKMLCIYLSSAGACTYTVAGSAPTTTAAHSFGDGVPVVPFCELLQDTNLAEDTHLVSWSVSYQ